MLKDLPIGTTVKFGRIYGNPIEWIIVSKNHYGENQVTLQSKYILRTACYSARDLESDDDRVRKNGLNRYFNSCIREYLNSSDQSWVKNSIPPSSTRVKNGIGAYDKDPGFLSEFTQREISALLYTNLYSTNWKGSEIGREALYDRVFLPSLREMGLPSFHVNGEPFDAYKGYGIVSTTYTEDCYLESESTDEVHMKVFLVRDDYDGFPNFVYGVSTVATHYVCNDAGMGIRPCINLKDTWEVSDNTIQIPSTPVISGEEMNLNYKTEDNPFVYDYTITNEDNSAVIVYEKLDGEELRNYVPTLGSENIFELTKDEYTKVLNGYHVAEIEATANGNTAYRAVPFSKNDTSIIVETSKMESDEMPLVCIVNVDASTPTGSTLKVEITNNANDEDPYWENISYKIPTNSKYLFTNKTKTAENWAVQIRVTLERGTATGLCTINSITGNWG